MTTPIATFGGLASGLDTGSLIQQLVQLERQPIRRIQSRQNALNNVSSRLTQLKDRMNALKDAASALDNRGDVFSSKATPSDTSILNATADGAAAVGRYNVVVNSLAQAERSHSGAFAAKDDADLVDAGTLSIKVGGNVVDIEIDEDDTLENVVAKINASDADVNASVIFDGEDFLLQVNGKNPGEDNKISFAEDGTNLNFSETVAATDASFEVDGIEMTRPTNAVTDAIEGVTFNLLETTDEDGITLNVEGDTEALTEKVETFVSAYNDIVRAINSEFTYTGSPRVGETLAGDSTLRQLQSTLASVKQQVIDDAPEAYQILANIGIETNNDGTLEFDSATFSEAVATDPEGVSQLIAGDAVTGDGGVMDSFEDLVTAYTRAGDGVLTSKISNIADRVSGMNDQIDNFERRIDKFEARISAQFTAMEQLVSNMQSQGNQMAGMLSGLE